MIPQETKNFPFSRFCCSGGPQSENKRKWEEKYLDLARELKRLWNIVVGALGTVLKGLEKKSDKESRPSDHNTED